MILCDTGPLVAMIDADDASHARCTECMARLPADTLVTTWSCLTEAMYLLWRAGGQRAQDELWEFVADGLVSIHEPAEDEWQRMRELMAQYADAPMDFADASLVAAAEILNLRRVFTLDRHFQAFRIHGKEPFDVRPQPRD